jgi:dihydroceramide fatty acyl 2-hydroxylase
MKEQRRRHMKHHFQDHTVGFGVSMPLWDHVFGTHEGR